VKNSLSHSLTFPSSTGAMPLMSVDNLPNFFVLRPVFPLAAREEDPAVDSDRRTLVKVKAAADRLACLKASPKAWRMELFFLPAFLAMAAAEEAMLSPSLSPPVADEEGAQAGPSASSSLTYSEVSRIRWSESGLTDWGTRSSASERSISSPVVKLRTLI